MPPTQPENRLLSALPPADFARLTARMTDVTVEHKEVVYRPGGPMDHVYFPRSGVLSAVVVMEDGATAEVAVIGREGMAGASTCLGATRCAEQVFCQVPPSECRKWAKAEFVAEVAKGGALRDVVYRYLRGALVTTARQAACNALHPNDERMAQWLLRCRDSVGSDEFQLTHEFLATMLGVRRATVTVTAGTLQSAGLISYRHGHVKVLDGEGLEEAACECYRVIHDAFNPPNS
jgi:CRP-like cAMP-binding protein